MAQGSRIRISFSPIACVYLSLVLLAIPVSWVLAWLAAAAFHELFHCIALWLCEKDIESIDIGIHGAKIRTSDLTPGEIVFCAFAGPLGGILLLLLFRVFPRVAVCAFVQTLFNLIPILPLDGGQALHGLLRLVLPERRLESTYKAIEVLIFAALITISILAAFLWKLGILPLLLTAALAIRRKKRKIPCKWSGVKVQ